MFCFSCYSGLRYSDVKTLRPQHIKDGVMVKRMVKTQRIETIPITPQAQRILDKYPVSESDVYRFKVPADGVLNRYIKEIGQIVGINTMTTIMKNKGGKSFEITKPKCEYITFHVGRHTFIILSLEKGIRVETIQKEVGRQDIKTTMRYVKILGSVVKNEFSQAWSED